DGVTEPPPVRIHELQELLKSTTVLLAPAGQFRRVAAALESRGARVAERGSANLRVLRLDGGAAATGVADAEMISVPEAPTPTPVAPAGGREVLLSSLTPHDVICGFAPPKVDRAWDDQPIVMGGIQHAHGLGTHAPCRLTYDVPADAMTFRAIVG